MTDEKCTDHKIGCECREKRYAQMEQALMNIQSRLSTPSSLEGIDAFLKFVKQETDDALKWK